MTITLYGLSNCDTCRKARRWLDNAGIEHAFVDVREQGVDADQLDTWTQHTGWEALLNRRSRAWRELPDAERTELNTTKAIALMQAHPTLIKRPVLATGDDILVGFDESRYEMKLAGR